MTTRCRMLWQAFSKHVAFYSAVVRDSWPPNLRNHVADFTVNHWCLSGRRDPLPGGFRKTKFWLALLQTPDCNLN